MATCDVEAMGEEAGCSGTGSKAPETAAPSGSYLAPRERERVREEMLAKLALTPAHFAHRQRDAPDLTALEKMDIAAQILDRSPATFLARFGKFLQASDLAYFRDMADDSYEIAFYLKEIGHRCSHSQVIVKNRRYSAMKELEEGGVYFSEDEMKRREPLLYEQMVGQFLTEEEQQQKAAAAIDRSDLRFSTILLTHLDHVRERALYQHQKEREDDQEEEEEESEEEEDDDEDEEEHGHQRERKTGMGEEEDSEAEDVPEISHIRAKDIWRQQLRDEFTAIMHEKFLCGEDSQFDYSQVDDNPDYDSLLTVAQDEENRYFLSEVPHTVHRDASHSLKPGACSMEEEEGEGEEEEGEEEEDYMMYEPSADLVAKSARFVQTGAWQDEEGVENG